MNANALAPFGVAESMSILKRERDSSTTLMVTINKGFVVCMKGLVLYLLAELHNTVHKFTVTVC